MILTEYEHERILGELVALLDREIEVLNLRGEQLEALGPVMLRRDDRGMERLLADIERTQREGTDLDARIAATRRRACDALGASGPDARVGEIAELAREPFRSQLLHRRERILALAAGLQQRNFRTALTLFECARINRLLLRTLLPPERSVTTYGAAGANTWCDRTGAFDAER